MLVNAMVIAGGKSSEDLHEISCVDNEALIPICDNIMVDYVITALRASSCVDKIVLVGPVERLRDEISDDSNIIFAESGGTPLESVLSGLTLIENDKKILISTGDIPLITAEAIENFLSQCVQDADIFYPVIPKDICQKKYPEMERTYVKLKDGTFTGGNLFLVNPDIIEDCAQKGEEVIRLRKNPLALSYFIGIRFLVKFLLNSITVREAEMKFSNLFGITGICVISNYPEIGFDVDKSSDLKIVKRILENKVVEKTS